MSREILAPPPASALTAAGPPTFSCVVAAYQVADVVGDAIDSILAQTYPPHEVVVVDDGSTDDLAAAIRRFGAAVTHLRQENRGAGAAMNTGARAATGDYVVFIGADDVFAPERLEALAELAQARPDLDVLTTDAWVSVHGQVFRRFYDATFPFEVDDQRAAILERNFVFGHTAVPRHRFLEVGGFDERIRWTSDWEIWARMILGGSRVGTIAQPLATYRLNERSLSAKRLQQARGRLMTYRRIVEHPSLTPDERASVARRMEHVQREIRSGEAKAALVTGAPGARTLSLGILRDRERALPTRLRALAAAIAPRAVGASLERRSRREWVAAGGLRVRRAADT